MSKEVRRFKISGKLKELVDENLKQRSQWLDECEAICKKYGFESYFETHADFFSGSKLTRFADPTKEADLSLFKKPNKGAYSPRAKEGKQVYEDIENMNHWSLKTIWDYLGFSPCPFNGSGGYYQDSKLKDELLFYTYNEEFKSHADLQELKKSEYFALIGE